MKFRVSEKHKRQGRRKALFAAALVIVLIAGSVLMFVSSSELSDKVIAAIGTFLLARYLPSAYRSIKNHDTSYPEVEIMESEGKIEISHNNAVVSMPLSDIVNLTLQCKSGRTNSILLTTKSFNNLRFEGYEGLEIMADVFKKHTPPGKVKIATWYHR